jgi:hypothetical protein
MSFLFFSSKYEKKHKLESIREQAIQYIQANQRCSREYAVRCYDYKKQLFSSEAIKFTSSLLYTFGAYKLLGAIKKDIPLVQKSWVKLPVLASGFWLGRVMYDKLVSHYLNFEDMDVAHTWERDLAAKYGLKDCPVNQTDEIPLTPYERMKRDYINRLNELNLEGEKQFKRLSKDKNDFYYLFGKIRNLENIVYLDKKELEDIKNPVQLQMKIDSVKPYLKTSGDINKIQDDTHVNLEQWKTYIENSRNLRSIKDKFLGLPFMMIRHQQFPEPARGTWQFDLYEQIFGEPYDFCKGEVEQEEKINKYNYHKFLHPSEIEKWDTNSEEFDIYLRKLHNQSKTKNEVRTLNREYYCTKILPVLNLVDKDTGCDFANYVINKSSESDYANYLYNQYSGQVEEKLFREAEEANYINKNQPVVQSLYLGNTDKNSIGVRASELNDLMNNPTKAKKMRRALEMKYPFYNPVRITDKLKAQANIKNYYHTIIDREIDTSSPDFKYEDLDALQNDKGEGLDNPELEPFYMFHINRRSQDGKDYNNNPYFIYDVDEYAYNPELDWNDYVKEGSFHNSFISPKNMRYESRQYHWESYLHNLFYRSFSNLEFEDKCGYVVPQEDYKNEELKQKVLLRSNYHRFVDSIELKNSQKAKLEFLENKTMDDSYAMSDDLTEEDLDQALFEASYSKPIWETEEFRGICF